MDRQPTVSCVRTLKGVQSHRPGAKGQRHTSDIIMLRFCPFPPFAYCFVKSEHVSTLKECAREGEVERRGETDQWKEA